jgi:methyl-accepting chemotaxis protein
MANDRTSRKMRNFLLDKRFQLKYTLAVVVISTVIATALGLSLYQAHRESSRVSSLDDPELDSALSEELRKEDQRVLLYLVVFLGGLVLALTSVGIVVTHKIAGPAYSIQYTLGQVADGKLTGIRPLRKGDELQSVGDELNRMIDQLVVHEKNELEKLSTLLSKLKESSEAPASVITCIEQLIEEKQNRLGSDS